MKLPSIQSSSLSNLEKLQEKRKEQMEKLSTGLKINQASDDPAGMQIANRLASSINESEVRIRNARDEQSIIDTQAGQYTAITDNLVRARELTVQAGNPLYDKQAIQAELDQLTEEINVIAEDVLGQSNFISGLDASDPSASQIVIDDAGEIIDANASAGGAKSNAIDSRVNNYQISSINTSEARSRIQDTDYAQSSADLLRTELQLKIAVILKKDEEERKGLLFNKFV
ncbi:flagellin [Shewanella eurypsychrophilus]|uniref:Flagellin n=1 Tax=Shewanella eurypsychrophilus TaxID=2593656 RepID=A0ABX6V8E9_9GAMM|nr:MULTISPECIES: flagellin [Shewanella]QFU22969.1 flagellin [Shewanella sp. YLB-09]QPG58255.1 flagellin [Shewanella eurypsychrophilus]